MAGSRAVSDCEPGQVRKEAALSGSAHAPRTNLAGAKARRARPGTCLDGGCTVHFSAWPSGESAAVRPADTMKVPMLSLYRRHRPRTFDEVVGQEPIVRTLRNAIELGKVHHAYLFVGSRDAAITPAMASSSPSQTTAPGRSPSATPTATGSAAPVAEIGATMLIVPAASAE